MGNRLRLPGRSQSVGAHQRRGAADRGEHRQAAGAVGKALKLWRNDPAAYPFDSNNVAAIPEFYSNRVMLGFALISIVIALMAVAVRF